jgi:hypothetical protein
MTEINTAQDGASGADRKGLFAALGLFGAFLASACLSPRLWLLRNRRPPQLR